MLTTKFRLQGAAHITCFPNPNKKGNKLVVATLFRAFPYVMRHCSVPHIANERPRRIKNIPFSSRHSYLSLINYYNNATVILFL